MCCRVVVFITDITIITIITGNGGLLCVGGDVAGDGHVLSTSEETNLGGVAHVEEKFCDGSYILVEQGGDFFGT